MKNSRKDNLKLICDIGELSGLFTDSTSLETFLSKTVEMVANHMSSQVCSVYLYNDRTEELVLKATVGLNKDLIGNVRMKISEGLTGLALKELRPICERCASHNTNFRYFHGLGEDQYESFLAVPIVRGKNRIGAMVIQNEEKDFFREEDIRALQAITSQLANTIEMASFIMSVDEKKHTIKVSKENVALKLVKGKVGSPGFAFEEAFILKNNMIDIVDINEKIKGKSFSVDDFYKAQSLSEKQLESLQEQIEEKLADVASLIFNAQILMLKDTAFIGAIEAMIKKGKTVPESISSIVQEYVKKFESIEDVYLRERSQDIKDVGQRLLKNLIGEDKAFLNCHCESKIVVAKDLSAADVLKLSSQNVKGIVLLSGGVTSHVCILASSLQMPVVIADEKRLLDLEEGTKILLDAEIGNVFVNPEEDVLGTFKEKQELLAKSKNVEKVIREETFTSDGQRVHLFANINLLGDLKIANDFKAEGVGLYRTEFPFIVRNNFPTEEEQFVIYKKLFEGMPRKEVTVRTLDIGGDKVLSYFQEHSKESNPFMGMRSIRFSLRNKDVFCQQIRAILRAGVGSEVKIMFPMISSLDEFLEAKGIVFECMDQLEKQKENYQKNVEIGMMIELPSVMGILEELAQESDFFSVGTNDFVQYMLAVDRTNEKVSDMYLAHHPSIIRALKQIVDVSNKFGREVSVCGEMAHDEKYIKILLGLGLRRFSLNPSYLPKIQETITALKISELNILAEKVLSLKTLAEVSGILLKNRASE